MYEEEEAIYLNWEVEIWTHAKRDESTGHLMHPSVLEQPVEIASNVQMSKINGKNKFMLFFTEFVGRLIAVVIATEI